MAFTAPEDELEKPPANGGFSAPDADLAPEGFTAPAEDVDHHIETLAADKEFIPAAHAAQNPDDFETAFQVHKAKKAKTAGEWIGRAADAATTGSNYVAAGKGVINFLRGIPEVGIHTVQQAVAQAPILKYSPLGPIARLMPEKAPETLQAENTLAAQHGEESLKHIIDATAGNLAAGAAKMDDPDPTRTAWRQGFVRRNPLKYTPEKIAQVQKEWAKEDAADRATRDEDIDRRVFAQRVQAAGNEIKLSRGEPLDTGFTAGIYHVAGQDPAEEVGPEALKGYGVPQADLSLVERMSAASDPTMLALAGAPSLPGASLVGGAATELTGKLMKAPMAIASAIPGKIGKYARGGAGTAAVIEGMMNPVLAAKVGGVVAGAKGLQMVGRALEAQGKELRTGIPSTFTTEAATAAATGKRALGANINRKFGDAASTAAATAAGMAPLNLALSEGDPEAFVQTEAGAAAFGGAFGAFKRNRPILVEAIRPHLQSEGTRALTEAANGNDPLAAKSMAYVMSLPPEARDRTLESIGALQGLPTKTGNGTQRAKLYVLSQPDYQNVIREKIGEKQAAMGGGRGFFIAEDGAAYVNGDYHAGIGASELSHTIGHEFGGHAAINVMRAAGAPGGQLYRGVIEAAKKGLYIHPPSGQRPSGTPTAEFRRFVDGYNKAFDPTGKTQRLDWRSPDAVEEFLAETAGHIMAHRGAGELAIPQNIQDRIASGLARFMGQFMGFDSRTIGTKTNFDREEVGSITQAMQDTLSQVVGMKLRGGREMPEPAKTDTTRIAELQATIARPRPAAGSPVADVRQWIAERRAAQKEMAELQPAPDPAFPAAGAAPTAPSKPTLIVSPDAVTKDAVAALGVMGIKGPLAQNLIRQANTQHGSPINDAAQLAAGAFRIHGKGTVKPGEFNAKPQVPAEPVPIPVGEKAHFKDETGAERVITGVSPDAPRIGDIVATRTGEIRRVTRVFGDTVDTARPIDPLNARGTKTHAIADVQPLAHDYAPETPGAATPAPATPALRVEPRGDRFIIVDAAGNPTSKNTFATESDANRSIAQKGKRSTFGLPPSADGNDIIDTIIEEGGVNLSKMSKEERENVFPHKGAWRNAIVTDDAAMAPDEAARLAAERGHGDGTPVRMFEMISEAIKARGQLRDQIAAEEKRLKAEEREAKKAPDEPAPTEPPPAIDVPQEPTVATAVSERPPDAPEPSTLLPEDVTRIAAEAEETVKAARTARHKPETLPKAVTDAQVDALAAAHEQGLPANYQGVRLRVDPLGKTTIAGTFNPTRPFDAFLLKLADLSQPATRVLMDLQSKIGQTVTVNYGHAPETEGKVTNEGRKAAQRASSAQARASGEAETQAQDKNFIPLEVRFNKGKDAPSITILGASPEKLLNNFNLAGEALTALGGEVPYRDIHDPRLVGDMKGVARNHANGWKGDGSARIDGFPDVSVPTPGEKYQPYKIDQDRFDFLNLILGDESAKTGSKGPSPEQKLKQGLAVKNGIRMTDAGETNILRESINRAKGAVIGQDGKPTTWSKATLENPLSEALRVDLINEVKPELNNADESIRKHGYAGTIDRFFKEGTPNRTFSAAGFLPDTGAPRTAKEKAQERLAARGKTPVTPQERREAIGRTDPKEAAQKRLDSASETNFIPTETMRDDMANQAGWLQSEAEVRGYKSPDELAESNPGEFRKLSSRWRLLHPRDEKGFLSQNDAARRINSVLYGDKNSDSTRPIAGTREAFRDAAQNVGGGKQASRSAQEQADGLRAYAAEKGLTFKRLPRKFEIGSENDKGGMEHHVWFDEKSNRWVKATTGRGTGMGMRPIVKGDSWALEKGSVKDYLESRDLWNKVFGDDIRFHGVWDDGRNVSVVTSQPDISGSPMSAHEIKQAMEAGGFTAMGDSVFYRKRDNVAVFDLHEGNAVNHDGAMIPFDGIIIHPSDELLDVLKFEKATGKANMPIDETAPKKDFMEAARQRLQMAR